MNGFLIILGIFRWTFILVLIRVFCWTGAHWVRRIYIPWYTFLASTLGSSLGSCSVLFTESFGSLHWGFRPRKIRDPFELQKTSEKTRGCTKVTVSISQSVNEVPWAKSTRFSCRVHWLLDPLVLTNVVLTHLACFIQFGTNTKVDRLYPRYLIESLMPSAKSSLYIQDGAPKIAKLVYKWLNYASCI